MHRGRVYRQGLAVKAAGELTEAPQGTLRLAVADAKEIKAQLREDAGKLAADLWMFDPVGPLAPAPRKVLKDGRWQRTHPEWEWLDTLSRPERKLAGSLMKPGGVSPDCLHLHFDCEPEDGPGLWVDLVMRRQAAKAMAVGKPPTTFDPDEVFRGESQVAAELSEAGVSLVGLYEGDGWLEGLGWLAAELIDSGRWGYPRST